LLLNIAREELEQIKYEHPFFELEEDQLLGNEEESGILERWLESEFDRIESGWGHLPVSFEFSFGIGSRKKKKVPVESIELEQNLKITGKIDRIELNESDPNNFIIADYKSKINNLSGNNDISNGTAFQMPLYIAAARKILRDLYKIEAEPYGGVYYAINPQFDKKENMFRSEKFVMLSPLSPLSSRLIDEKTNKPKKTPGTLDRHDDIEYMIERSLTHAISILDKISKGIFAIDTKKKSSCDYCSYQAVCRFCE
jgi:ATP-dependent helicase/DNAse subunit B